MMAELLRNKFYTTSLSFTLSSFIFYFSTISFPWMYNKNCENKDKNENTKE